MKRKHMMIACGLVGIMIVAALVIIPNKKTELKAGTYAHPGFGSDAVIIIKEDGTYTYSPGALSSYFGAGSWKLKGDKLYLTSGMEGEIYFKVENDTITAVEETKDRANYMAPIEKGEVFTYKN